MSKLKSLYDMEMPYDCSMVVGVEYRDGKLVKSASAFNANIENLFANAANNI